MTLTDSGLRPVCSYIWGTVNYLVSDQRRKHCQVQLHNILCHTTIWNYEMTTLHESEVPLVPPGLQRKHLDVLLTINMIPQVT